MNGSKFSLGLLTPTLSKETGEATLDFIAPSEIQDERLPGGRGELFPIKQGQVLLVCTMPGDADDETIKWVSRALTAIVDEGTADAAVYLPEGWKLGVAQVGCAKKS